MERAGSEIGRTEPSSGERPGPAKVRGVAPSTNGDGLLRDEGAGHPLLRPRDLSGSA